MDSVTPALQTYSILAATLAAGANLSTSIITFPALLHASGQTLVEQWKIMFDSGITPVVTLAMSSSVGFATLAYRAHSTPQLASAGVASHTKRNLYIAAALATVGLAPYTQLLMYGTINELSRRVTGGADKADTRALVEKWGRLNLWRGVLLLTGAGLGAWASVC